MTADPKHWWVLAVIGALAALAGHFWEAGL